MRSAVTIVLDIEFFEYLIRYYLPTYQLVIEIIRRVPKRFVPLHSYNT